MTTVKSVSHPAIVQIVGVEMDRRIVLAAHASNPSPRPSSATHGRRALAGSPAGPGGCPAIRSVSIPTAKSHGRDGVAVWGRAGRAPRSGRRSGPPCRVGARSASGRRPAAGAARPPRRYRPHPSSFAARVASAARCPPVNSASISYQQPLQHRCGNGADARPIRHQPRTLRRDAQHLPPSASTGCPAANSPGCTRTRKCAAVRHGRHCSPPRHTIRAAPLRAGGIGARPRTRHGLELHAGASRVRVGMDDPHQVGVRTVRPTGSIP